MTWKNVPPMLHLSLGFDDVSRVTEQRIPRPEVIVAIPAPSALMNKPKRELELMLKLGQSTPERRFRAPVNSSQRSLTRSAKTEAGSSVPACR
eukprot:scaffold6779_cov315-Pinguiococcus_pyrenoidosus.AAC.1